MKDLLIMFEKQSERSIHKHKNGVTVDHGQTEILGDTFIISF